MERGQVFWSQKGVQYSVAFVNGGPAAARNVKYRVIEGRDGEEVARETVTNLLMAGQRVDHVIVVSRREYERLIVMVRWSDIGPHEQAMLELPTRP